MIFHLKTDKNSVGTQTGKDAEKQIFSREVTVDCFAVGLCFTEAVTADIIRAGESSEELRKKTVSLSTTKSGQCHCNAASNRILTPFRTLASILQVSHFLSRTVTLENLFPPQYHESLGRSPNIVFKADGQNPSRQVSGKHL